MASNPTSEKAGLDALRALMFSVETNRFHQQVNYLRAVADRPNLPNDSIARMVEQLTEQVKEAKDAEREIPALVAMVRDARKAAEDALRYVEAKWAPGKEAPAPEAEKGVDTLRHVLFDTQRYTQAARKALRYAELPEVDSDNLGWAIDEAKQSRNEVLGAINEARAAIPMMEKLVANLNEAIDAAAKRHAQLRGGKEAGDRVPKYGGYNEMRPSDAFEPPAKWDEKYRRALNSLRESGKINMFGASPVLQQMFPNLSASEARSIVTYWMKTFKEADEKAAGPAPAPELLASLFSAAVGGGKAEKQAPAQTEKGWAVYQTIAGQALRATEEAMRITQNLAVMGGQTGDLSIAAANDTKRIKGYAESAVGSLKAAWRDVNKAFNEASGGPVDRKEAGEKGSVGEARSFADALSREVDAVNDAAMETSNLLRVIRALPGFSMPPGGSGNIIPQLTSAAGQMEDVVRKLESYGGFKEAPAPADANEKGWGVYQTIAGQALRATEEAMRITQNLAVMGGQTGDLSISAANDAKRIKGYAESAVGSLKAAWRDVNKAFNEASGGPVDRKEAGEKGSVGEARSFADALSREVDAVNDAAMETSNLLRVIRALPGFSMPPGGSGNIIPQLTSAAGQMEDVVRKLESYGGFKEAPAEKGLPLHPELASAYFSAGKQLLLQASNAAAGAWNIGSEVDEEKYANQTTDYTGTRRLVNDGLAKLWEGAKMLSAAARATPKNTKEAPVPGEKAIPQKSDFQSANTAARAIIGAIDTVFGQGRALAELTRNYHMRAQKNAQNGLDSLTEARNNYLDVQLETAAAVRDFGRLEEDVNSWREAPETEKPHPSTVQIGFDPLKGLTK